MRLGIYGGTFDPIHNGHLIVAQLVKDDLKLDRVLFLLSPQPPHKRPDKITPASDRIEMIRLAIAGNADFELSTIELDQPGPNYTVETLRRLQRTDDFAAAEFFLIIGTDNFVEFHQWREPEEICRLARIVVYPRQGFPAAHAMPEYRHNALLMSLPSIDLSSTSIRQPLPTLSTPPINHSIGMKTSFPQLGPF